MFAIGDRVIVLDTSSSYKGLYRGHHGAITYVSPCSIGLRLDAVKNPKSTYGRFYFPRTEIRPEICDERTHTIMKESYTPVKVRFLDDSAARTYTYGCYVEGLHIGDRVVVQSAHHGYGIAQIEDISEPVYAEPLPREVVCSVDFAQYLQRKDTRKHATELFKDMMERSRQLQEITLFETLAKADPKMAELLAQYKEVTNG